MARELSRTQEFILLQLLKRPSKKINFWELLKHGGTARIVAQEAEKLKKKGLVDLAESTIILKDPARVPSYLKKKPRPIEQVMDRWEKIRDMVHFGDPSLDQYQILRPGIQFKLQQMLDRYDLLERDVICIGDDDLFSVACALTELPRSVTVADYDDRILSFLADISSKLPVPIEPVKANFLEGVPRKLRNRFDLFVTEPPCSVRGMTLFIARGTECLREEGVAYFGMSEAALDRREWREIELNVLNMNYALTDIWHLSEPYEVYEEETWVGIDRVPKWVTKTATKPWFVSTLFRAELAGPKNVPAIAPPKSEAEIITDLFPVEKS